MNNPTGIQFTIVKPDKQTTLDIPQEVEEFKSLYRNIDTDICQKVTDVLIYRGKLLRFPQELSNFFPNLRTIHIYDCGLKSICGEDLKGFTKLEKLNVEENEISFLPKDLFKHTPNIVLICFADNKITKIAEEIFDNIKGWILFDLRGNPKINLKFIIGQKNLRRFKLLIQKYCKPMETLENLAKAVVKENMNAENCEYIRHIARQLTIFDIDETIKIFVVSNAIQLI